MDLLQELGLDPKVFMWSLALSTLILGLLYRRFFLNIFDPLVFFLLSSVASSTLVFGLPWEPRLKIIYVFFVLSFWIGFAMRGRIRLPKAGPLLLEPPILLRLELLLGALFCLICLSNLYVGITTGFPLFSGDPSVTKVTNYTGGLGAVRRIDALPFVFFASGCILFVVIGYKRLQFLTMLVAGSFFIVLTGSKSALAPISFILAFAIARPALMGSTPSVSAGLKRYGTLTFAVALGVAFLVPVLDTGSLGAGIAMLGKRLLFNGDVVLYYFPTRGLNPLLTHFRAWDYLVYLLGPTLASVRRTEVPPALGTVIMGTEDIGFGPNPQFFIVADIFFGPVMGCLYCLCLGYLLAWIRRSFFTPKPLNPLQMSLRLTLASSAFWFTTDSQMGFAAVFDLLIIVGPLFAFVCLLTGAAEAVALEQPS